MIKPPSAFIAGRIFIDAKYIWTEEMMCLMSSEGNERERAIYVEQNAKEVKGMSHAFCKISGFKFTPVFDDDQKAVIGTSVVFQNESDFGGSMPKWVIQKFTPAGIYEFYEELIAETKASNNNELI